MYRYNSGCLLDRSGSACHPSIYKPSAVYAQIIEGMAKGKCVCAYIYVDIHAHMSPLRWTLCASGRDVFSLQSAPSLSLSIHIWRSCIKNRILWDISVIQGETCVSYSFTAALLIHRDGFINEMISKTGITRPCTMYIYCSRDASTCYIVFSITTYIYIIQAIIIQFHAATLRIVQTVYIYILHK